MSNPLFPQNMGAGNGIPTVQQLQQEISRRFNLPQGMNMDRPADIINHLVSSGQIPQDRVNAAYQQAQRMGIIRPKQ